ncbi:MAG TPA: GTPase HflX [bacterium]|nr:GTPase HflX [bacterium]HNC49016.1 GTPase HflX [bacterium]HND76863.1 GTPase HflX [bacterium]HNE83397.1 GTPase HflX [bacterium]HNH29841.1 GTPase HflX [bacterium]
MNKTHDTTRKKERALLVGVAHDRQENRLVDDYLEELALLADTDGVEVVASVKQQLRQIDPSTYIGKGKVHEIVLKVQAENIQVVIFDDDLSPGQTKNIEREAKCKIIDRSALILDIFAKRARTRESKTQVELAQLEYLLPRLSKMWTHLERQGGGGVFTKGPGETQLETDRRLVGQRIAVLKEELKKIERQRETQRAGRGEVFRVALVGYTNVGKSTLLNALSQADVYVEDRLFATLDATTRKVFLDNDHSCLITDTVGFIRKLPHHLVASFRSTLEEVREADILLHVVDLSSPIFMEQMEAVEKVLRELNALKDARIVVFNKVDRVSDEALITSMRHQFPNSVFISAGRRIGLDRLKQAIKDEIDHAFTLDKVSFDSGDGKFYATVHHLAEVLEETYTDSKTTLHFRALKVNAERIKKLQSERADWDKV